MDSEIFSQLKLYLSLVDSAVVVNTGVSKQQDGVSVTADERTSITESTKNKIFCS